MDGSAQGMNSSAHADKTVNKARNNKSASDQLIVSEFADSNPNIGVALFASLGVSVVLKA